MTMSANTILLFTRYPYPGKCKTRLIPQYSAEEAAAIHRQLVFQSDKTINTYLAQHRTTAYHIYYTGASVKQMQHWLNSRSFILQQGKHLGERMANAFSTTLKSTKRCLIMGSDCPDISTDLLKNAFAILQERDIVLGPAYDGGYYLIGLKRTLSQKQITHLFADVPWGSEKVLTTTLTRIKELQLQCQLLPKLHDIDTPHDLKYFNHHSHTE